MSVLSEFSTVSPAVAAFNRKLFVAWTGTDQFRQLNIISADQPDPLNFSNKRILGQDSLTGPALAVFQGNLYYAWTGTDQFRQLNIWSSSDGINFSNKRILGQDSLTGPALAAFQGNLYYAWTGTDTQRQLNIMSSTDGLNFGNKFILGESSNFRPALTSAFTAPGESNRELFMAWTGTDGRLNIWSSSDGINFGNKQTFNEYSIGEPALGLQYDGIYLAWTGTDDHHSLNYMSSDFGANFGNKMTLQASSTAAPALAYVNPEEIDFGPFSHIYAAWIDPDQLNADALDVI